ncbi:type I restriction enzyme HsdR N-terminal domain-containing protein [Bacillus sp. JJ722]|uniref:type I restriction enzyme HsdR N-terminal domain-containing protein n=1 Tax=Bacillus sp. JJ722 TaxID=3122973 RepID=UPI002FFF3237
MKTYKNKNKKLLYDPCRQTFLQHTPEEKVRQDFIQFLIQDMKIPADSISTEFALNHIDSNSRQRADIVVWSRDREGNETALLVIELKAEHIDLTDHTIDQVKAYNEILKAKYIGVSNGTYVNLYEVNMEGIVPLTDDLYTYSQLLKGNVEYTQFRQLKRLAYDLTTYDRYINHLMNEGYIGDGTPGEMHSFISELQNFILCEEIHSKAQYKTTIIEDLSYGRFSFGNASGGKFPGYYRSFIVKDLDGNHAIYRIGIFGTAVLVNDPIYGNRNGNTYLTVAIDESGNSSNILQLNIDKYFKYSKEHEAYEILHSGRRNGFKNAEVLEYVQHYVPELIKNGKVYLGSLPANRAITSIDGSDFIERLLIYANIREKLAQRKKRKK